MVINNVIKYLILYLVALISVGCNIDDRSEIIHYTGKVSVPDLDTIPTDIEIYDSNMFFKVLDDSGNVRSNFYPTYPSRNGNFVIGVTTYSHGPNTEVNHWDCDPLRLYIRHPNYETYYDSLNREQLKELKQNSRGQWILPDITLTPLEK